MGTENTVMQYCKYSPPDTEITIYQTDIPHGKLSADQYDFGHSHPRIITVRSGAYRVSFVTKFRFGYPFFVFVILPIYFSVLLIAPSFRRLREELKVYDIVYLCQNYLSMIVPDGPVVVGSPHNFIATNSTLGQKVANKLVGNNLMWRRIDYFHMFPRGAWFLDKFKKQGFVLGNGTRFEPNLRKYRKYGDVVKFGYATRFEKCKGVLTVINAFEILKQNLGDRKIELNIYGGGSLYDKIEEQDGISKHGWIRDCDMPRILSSFDCAVYPTTCDNFPVVVLEALSAGSYVITSDLLRGVYDKFEQIGVLEYCPPETLAVAERMQNFINLNIPNEKFELSRQLILDEYSWKSIVNQLFEEFYKMTGK